MGALESRPRTLLSTHLGCCARRYLGSLATNWSAAGELTSYQGAPILLGGANSSNPVTDDTGVQAKITDLKGPITALSAEVVGECSRWPASDRYLFWMD